MIFKIEWNRGIFPSQYVHKNFPNCPGNWKNSREFPGTSPNLHYRKAFEKKKIRDILGDFPDVTDWHTCDKTQTCRQYKWISLTAELPFFLGYSHVSWIFVYWTFDLRLVHSIQPFHYYQFAQFYQDLKKSREQNSICVYLSRLKFLDPSLTTWGMISSSSSSNSSTFILIWCWKRPWMS